MHGAGNGHIQSLILAAVLLLLGFQTIIMGLMADVIASNRKILEDVQYHVRRMDYDGVRLLRELEQEKREEAGDTNAAQSNGPEAEKMPEAGG